MFIRSIFLFYLFYYSLAWERCTKFLYTDFLYSDLCQAGVDFKFPCGDILIKTNFSVSINAAEDQTLFVFSDFTYSSLNSTYSPQDVAWSALYWTYINGNLYYNNFINQPNNTCFYPFHTCSTKMNGSLLYGAYQFTPEIKGMQSYEQGGQYKHFNLFQNITLANPNGRILSPNNPYIEVDKPFYCRF